MSQPREIPSAANRPFPSNWTSIQALETSLCFSFRSVSKRISGLRGARFSLRAAGGQSAPTPLWRTACGDSPVATLKEFLSNNQALVKCGGRVWRSVDLSKPSRLFKPGRSIGEDFSAFIHLEPYLAETLARQGFSKYFYRRIAPLLWLTR
jgi:hypothetical protein